MKSRQKTKGTHSKETPWQGNAWPILEHIWLIVDNNMGKKGCLKKKDEGEKLAILLLM